WRTVARFDSPVLAATVARVVYAGFALWHGDPRAVSLFPYYNYRAYAFFPRQTGLRLPPPALTYLSLFYRPLSCTWFRFSPPVLVPFVAVWGVRFSDVGFTLALGAVNVALVAVLLRAAVAGRWLRLDRVRRGALVLCFALGTVHLTVAPFGRVWFTGQLVGFAALVLALLAALPRRGVP